MPLVGANVNDEDEGVVLLDLLHGGLGVQGVLDGLEGVESRLAGDGATGVGGGTGELEGFGEVEVGVGADFVDGFAGALESGLLGGSGLGGGGSCWGFNG